MTRPELSRHFENLMIGNREWTDPEKAVYRELHGEMMEPLREIAAKIRMMDDEKSELEDLTERFNAERSERGQDGDGRQEGSW